MQGADFPPKGKQHIYDGHDPMVSWTISMDNITDFESLYDSMNKCRKGVIWKDSVASFCLNSTEQIAKLSSELENGTYKSRPTLNFTITSPKPREISSISFRDRVYQRSLNDKAVYPIMTRSFIYDNFACQKGKGTDSARNRLKVFLQRFYRKHGTHGYVAQFDIRGYYPNMSHAVAEKVFRDKLPSEIYSQVERILREQYDGDKGYNAGSQLVQIAGISVLNGYDHFVKERLRAKYYLRYMDDFLIISEDREYLERCVNETQRHLAQLEFRLNLDKTRIYPLSDGIPFLGFIFRLTETGRVLMLIKSENVKRERKKLRRLVAKSRRGGLPKEKVDESYMVWRNHASKGNSFKLLQRMDKYYKELWRDI